MSSITPPTGRRLRTDAEKIAAMMTAQRPRRGDRHPRVAIVLRAPSWRGRFALACALDLVLVWLPPMARALDVFTLWRQEMIPLHMIEGAWADYRHLSQSGGRQTDDLLRIQCLSAEPAGEPGEAGEETVGTAKSWLVEIVPLIEVAPGRFEPLPGEGLRLRLGRELLLREGRLIDAVQDVVQWRDGQPRALPRSEWREDPLIAASFDQEFVPDTVVMEGTTTRVVARRELSCDQFQLAAADTQSVELPHDRMVQVTDHVITAALNAEIPFLGIVYAAERVHSYSELDPPSERFRPPPPQVRVEVMELLDFGNGAVPALSGLTEH